MCRQIWEDNFPMFSYGALLREIAFKPELMGKKLN